MATWWARSSFPWRWARLAVQPALTRLRSLRSAFSTSSHRRSSVWWWPPWDSLRILLLCAPLPLRCAISRFLKDTQAKIFRVQGIQRGHMKLHAKHIAMMAGASGDLIDLVAKKITEAGKVDVLEAKKVLAQVQNESRARL